MREDTATEKKIRCATNDTAKKLPRVGYENEAVRRIGNDTESLGAMCLLQAGAKPQTAMSHQLDGVDVAESQRNQTQKTFRYGRRLLEQPRSGCEHGRIRHDTEDGS